VTVNSISHAVINAIKASNRKDYGNQFTLFLISHFSDDMHQTKDFF
jgi:hypothetical protein